MTREPDFAETMRTRLRGDLREAMKRRDTVGISTLRCLIAAIDNAGAVDATEVLGAGPPGTATLSPYVATNLGGGPSEVARRRLSMDDIDAILAREHRLRETAADTLERHGRPTEALRAELAVIARYRA